ncbi:hypothetical protein L2722_00220 [Lactobacillus gasseri]|nr:hypothetical protein [Lactobacillus gasseri]MCZ3668554.1 hypothetical protein [Lactobacillus gasseri]
MDKHVYSKSWYGRRIVVKQLAYKDIGPYFAGYIGFDTQEFAAAYDRDDCIEILKEVAKKLASLNK